MRGVVGLVLGVVIAAIVAGGACGGAQPPRDWGEKLAKDNEITQLSLEIRSMRREAKMEIEPTRVDLFSVRDQPVRVVRAVCPESHEVPQTCNSICDLATAICDNAESICTIASELGSSDTYAQDKCSSAKASCREATQRCCGCSKAPPP